MGEFEGVHITHFSLCLKLGHFQLIMDERGAGDTTDSMTSEQMTIKRIK